MLDVAELVYAPRGNEANRWAGTGEFEAIAETWGRSDLCFGIGDPQELTLETPFGEASALIRLRTNERHPQLGTGLLGTIQLPIENECNVVARECVRLNLMETSWTDVPLFGCWSPHESREEKLLCCVHVVHSKRPVPTRVGHEHGALAGCESALGSHGTIPPASGQNHAGDLEGASRCCRRPLGSQPVRLALSEAADRASSAVRSPLPHRRASGFTFSAVSRHLDP
jgi:hypothetical protein